MSQEFEEGNFRLYSTRDGLSNKRVNDIKCDQYGFIWIATDGGLNRYDGTSFRQFHVDTGSGSLPGEVIKRLYWFRDSVLMAATDGGHFRINIKLLQGRNIRIPALNWRYEYRINNLWDAATNPQGEVLLLSSSGFYHFNAKDSLVFRYDHGVSADGVVPDMPFGRPRGIAVISPELVLLSTTEGLYSYQPQQRVIKKGADGYGGIDYGIFANGLRFHFTHQGARSFSVLMEASKELVFFDVKKQTKRILRAPFTTEDKFNWRTRLFELDDSTFILTRGDKGFYLVRSGMDTGAMEILPKLYFENYQVLAVERDKDGRFWIGTNRGLLHQKYQKARIEVWNVPEKMNPNLKNLSIRMVAVAADQLFVATNGEGLLILNRADFVPKHQIDFSLYTGFSNSIFNLLPLNEDSVLVGSYGPLVSVSTGNFGHKPVPLDDWRLENHWIGAQFKDSRGNIFLCRNTVEQYYIRPAGKRKFELVQHAGNRYFDISSPRNISEDPEGNIWFSGHGISRLNMKTGQIDWKLDSFPKIRVARFETSNLQFDKTGKMYFGVAYSGLVIYDPVSRSYKHITRSNGLPDNNILALFLKDSTLWIGTDGGLASYHIYSGKVSSFGIADDFPESGFTAYSFHYDAPNNHLYAAFNNSLVRFNPDSLQKSDIPPKMFIESVLVNQDRTIFHPGDTLKLGHKQNSLFIQLAAINYEDAFQQQFSYRFRDTDDSSWQNLGRQPQIILGNLLPGTYRLEYKVFIKTAVWPEQVRELVIIIQPPFWQKSWFRILSGMMLLASLLAAFRLRMMNERRKAEIDRKLAELEMKGLHAQMNPHFVFNSLNSIKEMILDDRKKEASRYLSKFAQLIRTSLEQSSQTFISVRQCVDHLQQYLEMEKIRFDDFDYVIHVDAEVSPDDVRLAPMLVQPLVENAIWHGLRTKPGEKKVTIRFYRNKSLLVCEIDDNGIGIHQSVREKGGLSVTHRSMGIDNIQERLRILNEKYNMNCSLSIVDKSDLGKSEGTGTLATLNITI